MTPENDLDVELDLSRHGTILSIIADSQDKLLNTHGAYYFTIDTGFLSPTGFDGMWQWLSGAMRTLVGLSASIARETVPHRFHRLFIIPDPIEYDNNFQRDRYRQIIRDVLHFHVWHGVVCYPVFVKTAEYDTKSLLRSTDFGAVSDKIVYDTAHYYTRTFKGLKVVEGSAAHGYVSRALSVLKRRDVNAIGALYYDPKTFSHERREDRQWESLRLFAYRLASGICSGPECSKKVRLDDAALDHIVPRQLSTNVLLNLRLLCGSCNRNKWKYITHEEPFRTAFAVVPKALASEEVREILGDQIPEWLSRYNEPPVNVLRLLGV